MKLLVVIVNYGINQLTYLERMVKEFQSMRFDVDIIIHSNIPLNYENIEVKIIKLNDYENLPFTTRKTIYDKRNDYDLFIYSENDHLITQKNIKSFLEVTKILPENYIAGFIRYEKYDGKLFYPDYHKNFKWGVKSVFQIGEYLFAEFSNVHQGSFILTKQQLLKAIKNFDFLNESFRTKYSLKYRLGEFIKSLLIRLFGNFPKYYDRFSRKCFENKVLKDFIERNNLLINLFNFDYSIKCRVGTDIYLYTGLNKVIPISHFDDFIIYHMPNKYKGHLGKFDEVMRRDITEMIAIIKN